MQGFLSSGTLGYHCTKDKYVTILVLWELFADITMEIIVALLLSSNLCKICLSGWI